MTTMTHPEVQITADADVPVIRIVREFDAPAAQVFRAHVEPDLVARWLGPDSVETTLETWDCRTGGSYRYSCSRGDESYGFYGSFHEVRPAERIVQTFTFDGQPDGVSLETLTLEELDGGRCRLTALSVVESMEIRDAILSSGMDVGVSEGYAKLDDLLPTL